MTLIGIKNDKSPVLQTPGFHTLAFLLTGTIYKQGRDAKTTTTPARKECQMKNKIQYIEIGKPSAPISLTDVKNHIMEMLTEIAKEHHPEMNSEKLKERVDRAYINVTTSRNPKDWI
jgi:hypothetical protein